MTQNSRLSKKTSNLLHYGLLILGIIGSWFFAHWLKNLYLGDFVTHQQHFTTTTIVNFWLLILSLIVACNCFKHFAFTLVELAIVLIVIGFIIAGVMGGISLVQAAKLNAVITEVRNIQSAALNFRSRYNAIPGDMPTAASIFGTTLCGANSSGATNSCNGDGNTYINSNFGANLNNGPIEDLKYWHHLVLSQMLPGSYNGTIVSGIRQSAGVNVPASNYGSGGAYNAQDMSGLYGYPYGNILILASYSNSGLYRNGLVKPLDAYNIDLKIDDGNGGAGNVITFRGANVTGSSVCMSTYAVLPVTYLLTDTSSSCQMGFYSMFQQ